MDRCSLSHLGALALTLAWLQGCATTTTTSEHGTPKPAGATITHPTVRMDDGLQRAAADRLARDFEGAKLARDFGKMWDMTAPQFRTITIAIGRAIAERDDSAARAQGFPSPSAVKGLTDREYFIRSRQGHATRNRFVHKQGVTVATVAVAPALMIPFPGARLRVLPVTVTLSDGSVDKLGAARIKDQWRIVSENTVSAKR